MALLQLLLYLGVLGLVVLALIYWYKSRAPLVISSQPDILKKVPALLSFRPSLTALVGKWATYRAFTRKKPLRRPYRDPITLPDGGTVAFDWFHLNQKEQQGESSPVPDVNDEAPKIALICHGINGSSSEPYIRCLARRFRKHPGGWYACCLCLRGCAGLELTSPMGYSGAMSEDIHYAVRVLIERYPKCHIYVIGFSFGANLVGKYMGEGRSVIRPLRQFKYPEMLEDPRTKCDVARELPCPSPPSNVRAAVCVSTPFDFESLDRNLDPKSHLFMTRGLVKYFMKHQEVLKQALNFDVEEIKKLRNLSSFNTVYYQALGYEKPGHYYKEASSKRYIDGADRPVLYLHSLDDPISLRNTIPTPEEIKRNPNLTFALTRAGGHMGWFRPRGADTWDEDVILQFVNSIEERYSAGSAATDEAARPKCN